MPKKVSYLRDVSHCEVSPYVREVTVATVEPAQNSDKLDTVTFEETGRFALIGRGNHKPGDTVFFIPAESVLPLELSDALDITKYTSRSRIRVTKLRGNRSEGLVVDKAVVEPYLPYIMKWEDPPSSHMRGDQRAAKGIALEFEKFYKMPNLLDEPKLFNVGEHLAWSIKIHGTNCRFGYLQNPQTEEYELYVGSHNVVLRESEVNLYWQVIKSLLVDKHIYPDNMDSIKDLVFYGEIYGPGIQKGFHYDETVPTVKVFSMKQKYDYVDVGTLRETCGKLGFPVVEHHKTTFRSLSELRDIADNVEGLTTSHINEGIVVVSTERPSVMAKLISFNYLALNDRTERH